MSINISRFEFRLGRRTTTSHNPKHDSINPLSSKSTQAAIRKKMEESFDKTPKPGYIYAFTPTTFRGKHYVGKRLVSFKDLDFKAESPIKIGHTKNQSERLAKIEEEKREKEKKKKQKEKEKRENEKQKEKKRMMKKGKINVNVNVFAGKGEGNDNVEGEIDGVLDGDDEEEEVPREVPDPKLRSVELRMMEIRSKCKYEVKVLNIWEEAMHKDFTERLIHLELMDKDREFKYLSYIPPREICRGCKIKHREFWRGKKHPRTGDDGQNQTEEEEEMGSGLEMALEEIEEVVVRWVAWVNYWGLEESKRPNPPPREMFPPDMRGSGGSGGAGGSGDDTQPHRGLGQIHNFEPTQPSEIHVTTSPHQNEVDPSLDTDSEIPGQRVGVQESGTMDMEIHLEVETGGRQVEVDITRSELPAPPSPVQVPAATPEDVDQAARELAALSMSGTPPPPTPQREVESESEPSPSQELDHIVQSIADWRLTSPSSTQREVESESDKDVQESSAPGIAGIPSSSSPPPLREPEPESEPSLSQDLDQVVQSLANWIITSPSPPPLREPEPESEPSLSQDLDHVVQSLANWRLTSPCPPNPPPTPTPPPPSSLLAPQPPPEVEPQRSPIITRSQSRARSRASAINETATAATPEVDVHRLQRKLRKTLRQANFQMMALNRLFRRKKQY
ncbi:hypothetical protein DFH27DRAFT_343906 [Peziza echinospora]|nr:hypothetical protein DFH27DRAFT_343906 [Peziza echinospora]